MIRMNRLSLLTVALSGFMFLANPIDANATSYKMTVNGTGRTEGTITKVNLDEANIKIDSESAFKLKSNSFTEYNIVFDNGEVVGSIEVFYDLDSTMDKLVKCEKSNFITESNIYKEIVVNEVDDFRCVTYKVNDRKQVIYHNDDITILIKGDESDEVAYGNNYLNKFLEYISINLQE